jgi:putative membrane protein
MIHRTVYFFCALLPFGLVTSIGWLTPVFAVFVAYAFMAHEAIASQIEDPFGTEDNDLALETMSAGIDVALHDLIGDPVPAAPPPPDRQTLLL